MTRAEARARYPQLANCIAGRFVADAGARTDAVIDPATGELLGRLPHASEAQIAEALDCAGQGFALWRRVPALDRSRRLRGIAGLIRARADAIAPLITLELGKPHREALIEVATAADMFEWAAEEARRSYGRTIPPRVPGMRLTVERVPVGPVAGFAGWNAPLITPARKIAGALGAGCSIVIKPAEATPAVALALMRCVLDADVPPAVVQMLFGDPALIAQRLLESEVIRLVTFTGSVAVGKQLTALAARSMKRTIMELGGHAPVIVCDDADIEAVAPAAVAAKFRNGGQVCTSPTRFLVQRGAYDRFAAAIVATTRRLRVGDGFDEATTMGPLANPRRLDAVGALVDDAVRAGATLATGGRRLDGAGCFFEPTVLLDVPASCRAMREEPFGPLALLEPFDDVEDAIARANALPLGLAGYVFTSDTRRAALFRERIEVGTLAINGFTASWPETPFGGVRDSGLGSEGGIEGFQAFQQVKFISEA